MSDGVVAGGHALSRLDEVQLNSRTVVIDTAYTVVATDRLVVYTSLTNTRIVQLPASSAYPLGAQLTILDETGSCSPSVPIIVQVHAGDTINGINSTAFIQAPYGYIRLETNQGGKWAIIGFDLASNLLALPTVLPASSGIPWMSGGLLEVSQP